ncbi:MAG: glycosyltransferase [Anaerolineae bacterium]|nr:glycosyltransferase [Anaerolineae bacterium]
MRIGIFSNTYKPVISGVVTSISLFRRGLMERGHEVFVFAPTCRGYEDDEEGIFRYPAIDLPESLNSSLALPFSPRISRLLPTLGLDVIHSHHPIIMGNEAVRVARKLEVPLVFTCHSRYEDFSEYVPVGQLGDPLVKMAIRRLVTDYANECDLVLCPAQHVRRLLEEYGVTRPMEIVPSPVRLDAFAHGEGGWVRQKHGFGAGERVLVYVGRLALEKDISFLLRAFRRVLAQEPRGRLLLVGSGPEEKHLRRLAEELDIAERVVFAGYVEHVQVPDYLAAADLFVFASWSETQGLSLLEAMAAGLPAVVVRTWATEEMLTPGVDGVLVEADEAAFAAAVVHLLRDEEQRAALAQQARRTAQRYSIEACAERLEQAYEGVRGAKGKAST